MPFYLVTQTSLVEAEDEVAAAEKSFRQILDAEHVPFSVKFDEQTITLVSVRAPSKILEETTAIGSEPAAPAEPEHDALAALQPAATTTLGRGFLSMVGLVATGVMVGAAWSHWMG